MSVDSPDGQRAGRRQPVDGGDAEILFSQIGGDHNQHVLGPELFGQVDEVVARPRGWVCYQGDAPSCSDDVSQHVVAGCGVRAAAAHLDPGARRDVLDQNLGIGAFGHLKDARFDAFPQGYGVGDRKADKQTDKVRVGQHP